MDKKITFVRKKLFKTAIISVVVVIGLAVGMYFSQTYVEDVQLERNSKEGAVNAVRAQLSELTQEMQSGQQQTHLHDTFVKNRSSSMTLNREQAMKWIVSQREKHHLVNMSISIPPFTTVQKDTFPLKTGEMIRSEVKITFDSITDHSVLTFISVLQKELPGAVFMKDIKINRTSDLSRNVLMELSNHRIIPIVNAEVVFDWIGIREESKDKANAR